MTGPVIPAPSTRVVEQHSGIVLSGEGLRVANDRLPMVEALARIDALQRDNERLQRKLDDTRAELDNTLPVAYALEKANKILLDVSRNYKKQADEFEDQAQELYDANTEMLGLLRTVRADAQFQKARADGYVDELDEVHELRCRVQELAAEVRELRGES